MAVGRERLYPFRYYVHNAPCEMSVFLWGNRRGVAKAQTTIIGVVYTYAQLAKFGLNFRMGSRYRN